MPYKVTLKQSLKRPSHLTVTHKKTALMYAKAWKKLGKVHISKI